jgi:hypothetical protein
MLNTGNYAAQPKKRGAIQALKGNIAASAGNNKKGRIAAYFRWQRWCF